jgi:hypothetical protein
MHMTSVCSTKFRLFRLLVIACLFLTVSAVAGCKGKANVVGKVRYNGKELTFGSVSIEGENGIVIVGQIGTDGSYRVEGVNRGKARVSVSAMNEKFGEMMAALAGQGKAMPKDEEAAKKMAGRSGASGPGQGVNIDPQQYSAIPLFYQDFGTSGLTVDVNSSETKYDIELREIK